MTDNGTPTTTLFLMDPIEYLRITITENRPQLAGIRITGTRHKSTRSTINAEIRPTVHRNVLQRKEIGYNS